MAVYEIYRFRHRARLRYLLGVIRRTGVASSDLQRRRLWAPSNVGEFLFPCEVEKRLVYSKFVSLFTFVALALPSSGRAQQENVIISQTLTSQNSSLILIEEFHHI